MRKNILAGIIGTLLAFFAAELVIRLSGYSTAVERKHMVFSSDKGFDIKAGIIPATHFLFVRDPYLFWRLKSVPSDEFHAVNSQGFRGRNINPKKDVNTLRIFSIGDSCTFGLGVKYQEAYHFLLEVQLNKSSKRKKYEVINAGVPGYSSLQGERYLERDIIGYKPDLVIASFGWNDTMEALFYADKEQKAPPQFILSAHSFFVHSKLYLFLNDIISGLIYRKRPAEFVRVPKEDFIANLTKIYDLGRLNNFKVIFLNQPCRTSQHRYNDILKELCRQKQILFVDLREKFDNSNFTAEELFNDDIHPTFLGHRIIAESIFDLLKKERVLGD